MLGCGMSMGHVRMTENEHVCLREREKKENSEGIFFGVGKAW